MTLSAATENYLRALTPWADIAPSALACLSRPSFAGPFDERRLCDEAGLPSTQAIALIAFLRKLCELGLLEERADLKWQIKVPPNTLTSLAPLVAAIAFYRSALHRDETTARVVLTRPGHPSKLEDALRSMGFAAGRLEVTSEAFEDIAATARKRLVVMTPFLDIHGAGWLSNLLKRAQPSVQRTVILRYLSDPSHPSHPEGFSALRATLTTLGVEMLDYALRRSGTVGIETFHAKVVLADDDYAYVGSANMNRSSLENAMELGVLMRGEAARAVGRVVNAIRAVCKADE